MVKFTDLGEDLQQEAVPVDMEKMPDQIKEFTPLPQPGPGFVFRFPQVRLADDNWDAAGQQDNRISYSFRKGKELLIVNAPREEYIGQKVGWMVSNVESQWGGKSNEGKSAVSQMDFLLRDGFGIVLPSNTPNAGYAQALTQVSNRLVSARVRWSGSCNSKKDIYRVQTDAEGNVIFAGEVKGVKGCGTRYGLQYRKAKKAGDPDTLVIPRYTEEDGPEWNGLYMDRFTCLKCGGKTGARISVFMDLGEFERAGQDEDAVVAEGAEGTVEETPTELEPEPEPAPAPPPPAPVKAAAPSKPAGQAPAAPAKGGAPRPPSKPAARR